MMQADLYNAEGQLCDADGMVRRGAMHHGTDYFCTGHAHHAGMHIRCTNPIHVREFGPTPGPWYPATLVAAPALRDRVHTGGRTVRLGTAQPIQEVTFQ